MRKQANIVNYRTIHLFLLAILVGSVSANPNDRIDWLGSTESVVFQPANGGAWYPRLLELDNGDWLCVYDTKEWSETYTRTCISKSTNKGSTWSYLSQSSFGTGNAGNGQLIQLTNGDLLCAYRLVNEPTKTLKVSRSTNNGQSWSDLSTIISNTGGVWEPHIIQKADGQLLVLYAQDENRDGYDQVIEMQRSDDSGATWHSPQTVCGATWSRDGMPVPEILDNGDILVVLEGHYNPGEPFSIISVRSSDGGDSWGSRQLVYDPPGYAAAPFVVRVPTGEIVVSFQTNDVPPGYGEEMGIVMSWDDGNSWSSQPRPFSGEDGGSYYWNSLFVEDTNTIVAATSAWGVGSDNIKIIKGTVQDCAYEFAYLYGDFAGGCDVDFVDFAVLALAWLTEEGQAGWNPNCDIAVPSDNVIDEKDLNVFTDNWLFGK